MRNTISNIKQKNEIHGIIIKEHNGLYEDLILDLINKVKIFGFHFASLDIRQDSRIHSKVFEEMFGTSEAEQATRYKQRLVYMGDTGNSRI